MSSNRSFLVKIALLSFLIFPSFQIDKAAPVAQEVMNFGQFGKITLYKPQKTPRSLALFVSGDGGWQFGVINMAKYLAMQGVLVAGIDAKYFAASMSKLTSECYYPAADFEQLSMVIQKKYNFTDYSKPVLVGYSYGATLVYGLLAQAPSGTFKGAIGLGFCPDIELKKPLCKGNGLSSHVLKTGTYYLDRTEKLTAPFIVLNGVKDKSCPFDATAKFMKSMPDAELVTLPKVGHGFSIADNWLPQFRQAYMKIQQTNQPVKAGVRLQTNLPLTLVRAASEKNNALVFMISGDGGWTSFDQGLAETFAKKGYDVLGLDAQKYFWKAKTPEKAASEIEKAIGIYMDQLKKKSFLLVGYSFGADVVPFVASRISEPLKSSLSGVCMLSPEEYNDFEIHVADMLNFGSKEGKYNVLRETEALKSIKHLCMFGDKEDSATARQFKEKGLPVVILPGGHHYDNDYQAVVNNILTRVK
ncbi:AcvB/VirJ family lysyl-phosphatidylglycerol hydrolase [Emticicia sp. CRIBPO]|uniref:AcvB/VirJ family lysyl-phosphatidylglycerol hydrolase n=1 Tax=Emticicia sp. CRIBPO TaxID=2683258 RepID=UPI00197AF113|nr:AcvB/VirJ family lysyl-phosphatidylglycerol hydrolase [Emticicia sp. CRIBPO]